MREQHGTVGDGAPRATGWTRYLAAMTMAMVMAASLAACGGGGDGPTGPPVAASVSVTGGGTLSSIGETLTLTATPRDARGGAIAGATVTWSSSSPSVATVAGGVVTAMGNGTATISATAGTVSGSAQVTVQQVAAQLQVASPRDTLTALGDTARLTASARDARGNEMSGVTVSWSSSVPTVASVDPATGLVTALAEGSTQLRAAVGSASAERTIVVSQRAARLAILTQPASAQAGVIMPTAPRIQVQDARGTPIGSDNATVVTVTVSDDAGTVVSGGSATASGGVATFSALAVGGTAGSRTLRFGATGAASVTSAPFTLSPGLPAVVAVVSGGGQSGLAGTPLAQPLVAAVRDAWENGVANAPVAFEVTAGGGTVQVAEAITNAGGMAATGFTLGRHAGTATVRARSSAVPSGEALFQVTGTPNGVIRGTMTVGAAASVASAGRTAPAVAQAGGKRSRAISSGVDVRIAAARSTVGASRPVIRPPGGTEAADQSSSSGAASRQEAVPGEFIVGYRATSVGAPASVRAFADASVVRAVRDELLEAIAPVVDDGLADVRGVSPAVQAVRLRVSPGVDEAALLARLRADPRVAFIEPNGIARRDLVEPAPIEALLGELAVAPAASRPLAEQLHATAHRFSYFGALLASYPGSGIFPDTDRYRHQAWHYNMVGLPQAWAITTGSTSVLVAVVDDGTRFDHPAMEGVQTSDGYDFVSAGTVPACAGGTISVNGDGDGYDPDPTIPAYHSWNGTLNCANALSTAGGHGLHVSGTIGATRTNVSGLVGTAWQVRIRPVRALGVTGFGSWYDIAQGILYAAGLPADNGSGGTVTPAGGPARVINASLGGSSFSSVLADAVAAAIANNAVFVASAGNTNSSVTRYPASLPGVISVSALRPDGTRASYSSFHPTVAVAAPGGQVSLGENSGVLSSGWNFVASTPTTMAWQGTSMAAPHVTGIVALLLAREPTLTPAQVRQRLMNFAVDIGAPGPDQLYGAGMVNARNVLTSTMAPPRTRRVRLVNALTGATVRTVAASASGAFEFDALPDGSYWVFGGEDENGDGLLGLPPRNWGARGLAAVPLAVVVDGADVYPADFSVSTPWELEPNNTAELADELVVDGWMRGLIQDADDVDVYRLRIPQAGTYRLQATGLHGGCGFGAESNPVVGLFTASGDLLVESSQISNADWCVRIDRELAAGSYWVRVRGYENSTGRYLLSVRRQ